MADFQDNTIAEWQHQGESGAPAADDEAELANLEAALYGTDTYEGGTIEDPGSAEAEVSQIISILDDPFHHDSVLVLVMNMNTWEALGTTIAVLKSVRFVAYGRQTESNCGCSPADFALHHQASERCATKPAFLDCMASFSTPGLRDMLRCMRGPSNSLLLNSNTRTFQDLHYRPRPNLNVPHYFPHYARPPPQPTRAILIPLWASTPPSHLTTTGLHVSTPTLPMTLQANVHRSSC